jgi:hypothetical protein
MGATAVPSVCAAFMGARVRVEFLIREEFSAALQQKASGKRGFVARGNGWMLR